MRGQLPEVLAGVIMGLQRAGRCWVVGFWLRAGKAGRPTGLICGGSAKPPGRICLGQWVE